MQKRMIISTNHYQEIDQYNGDSGLEPWFDNMGDVLEAMGQERTDIIIVDTGSKDGSIEWARDHGAIVVVDDIIKREGYGPARNHLRQMVREHFPTAVWSCYLDGDERIDESDFHILRTTKDTLSDEYDVIAFPRIDWIDIERTEAKKDVYTFPDWQGRMTRVDSPLQYGRMLHEQIMNCRGIYTNVDFTKINHFHRSVPQQKRDAIGKLCADLHERDTEFGHTYPVHHKEMMYREMLEKEGLD